MFESFERIDDGYSGYGIITKKPIFIQPDKKKLETESEISDHLMLQWDYFLINSPILKQEIAKYLRNLEMKNLKEILKCSTEMPPYELLCKIIEQLPWCKTSDES